MSDYVASRARLNESIAITRELGDRRLIAYGQLFLAWPVLVAGEYETMRSLAEESVTAFRTVGDEWGIAMALCSLGIARAESADQAVSQALLRREPRHLPPARRRLGYRQGAQQPR